LRRGDKKANDIGGLAVKFGSLLSHKAHGTLVRPLQGIIPLTRHEFVTSPS
jgi:hypothetical protein